MYIDRDEAKKANSLSDLFVVSTTYQFNLVMR